MYTKEINPMTKKKTPKPNYNTMVITALANEFGFSGRYIRKAVSGELKTETGDTIRKKYKELENKVAETLSQNAPVKGN